jgi:hypothetical protein
MVEARRRQSRRTPKVLGGAVEMVVILRSVFGDEGSAF